MKTAPKPTRARVRRPAQSSRTSLKPSETRALSPEEQRIWDGLDRAPRPPGRPKVGQGARNVLISFELGLLQRADAFARKHGVGRSQLIARAIERYLRDAVEMESELQTSHRATDHRGG